MHLYVVCFLKRMWHSVFTICSDLALVLIWIPIVFHFHSQLHSVLLSSTQLYCSQLFCQCIWWLEDEFQDFCFDLCSGDVMTFVLLMVGGWVTQSFRTSVMTFVLVDEMGKSDFLTLLKRVSWNFVKRKVHDRLTNRLKSRVGKCHGYDGYIRVKKLGSWGKNFGRPKLLAKTSHFCGRCVQNI